MTRILARDAATNDIDVPVLVMLISDPAFNFGEVTETITAALEDEELSLIGSFDPDDIYDFRSQRPQIHYKDGHIVDIDMPSLDLTVASDLEGTRFLMLRGQVPDYRWGDVAGEIFDIMEERKIEQVFSVAGVPAPTSHTRPVDMIIRTTKAQPNDSIVPGEVTHPGTFEDYFEYQAGLQDLRMTSIRVRVPVYLARGEYAAGAAAGLDMLGKCTKLSLPVGDLVERAAKATQELNERMAEDPDLAEMVRGLEEAHDSPEAQEGLVKPAGEMTIPSAEEIGRAAEQYLESVVFKEDVGESPFVFTSGMPLEDLGYSAVFGDSDIFGIDGQGPDDLDQDGSEFGFADHRPEDPNSDGHYSGEPGPAEPDSGEPDTGEPDHGEPDAQPDAHNRGWE